jgi:predicted nucleic acid-binding protein
MLSSYTLVLDANILIRAVLGEKVKNLIMANHQKINFFTPDICIADAKKYLPTLLKKRNLHYELATRSLTKLTTLIEIVEEVIYKEYSNEVKMRMKPRDIEDWPIAATALALNSPI